jgi:hypothetical protein
MLSVMPMGLVEEDNSYFRKKVAGYGVMLAVLSHL